ncbi:UNC93-like protein MFSD11 [Tigriopus californicus]|uniref:UNC93-like protein MFSD11 n=1 Tax=Tigriopus californicus TaxID=6832 RepID=UPI0027D9E4F6|nr:UNC93-like protein MFSD11 [Tigriopus californicus]
MMRLARWIHNICFHPTMDVTTTKNLNVALLGLAFMLIFTAFQTMGNIQTTLLQSAANPDSSGFVPGFHGSGYTSLAIIYAVFATANWVSPPVVAWLGSRLTMVVGALLYAVFIAQFYWPNDILLYGSSALIGLGAAILWTAQGNFLTLNSDSATMTRNSGVFWAMLMSSNLIGNTFVFFQFRGLTDIDEHTRSVVVIVLLVISLAGTAVLFLLRKPSWTLDGPQAPDTPTQAFQKAWRLFLTPQMLLLCVTFFYTGLELTFWSGVYGPSIGFTKAFGLQAKSLVGLHGILIGAGEIVGGLLFGIFGHVVVKRGRDPIIILGFLTHCITFFGIFLNLPNSAPSGNADHASAYIESNAYLAIACSFSLGFGDACYNTQIFSILGSVYSDNSAGAFALFKFVQSTGAALAFFYSYVAPLYYQLLFLVILCVLGTLTFLRVELNTRRAAGSIPVPTVDDNESFQGDIVEQPGNQLVH